MIAKWLAAHPRFHMHHTPTYSSWLNQVERWFALLTDKKLRRGAHRSIQALEKDIRDWIAAWNEQPPTLHLDQDRRRDPRTGTPEVYGWTVDADGEAGGSPIQETLVRAGAALTTPGRVGTARRCGSGQRDEKVYARNQCLTPLSGPPALWRIWAGRGAYPAPLCGGGELLVAM